MTSFFWGGAKLFLKEEGKDKRGAIAWKSETRGNGCFSAVCEETPHESNIVPESDLRRDAILSAGFIEHPGISQAENGAKPLGLDAEPEQQNAFLNLLEPKRRNDGFWVSFAKLPHDPHIAQ